MFPSAVCFLSVNFLPGARDVAEKLKSWPCRNEDQLEFGCPETHEKARTPCLPPVTPTQKAETDDPQNKLAHRPVLGLVRDPASES